MHKPLPDFAEAAAVPILEVRSPSLVAVVPTAMVLVDYAARGLATPTADVGVLVESLPEEFLAASHAVRAALAHGTALRGFMLAQVPAQHPGHVEWPALRSWLSKLSDEQMAGLIEYGIRANLAYDNPDVVVPVASQVAGSTMATGDLRRSAARVLADWSVPDPDRAAAHLLERPDAARATLIGLLDAIWDCWLAERWDDVRRTSPKAAGPVAGAANAAMSGSQWVAWTTGLRPDARYAEAADLAPRLVVMACPGLGRSLTLFDVDDTTFVLHSPNPAPVAAGGVTDGVALTDLAVLGPVLRALGDTTRLSIVLQLIENGPSTMGELADATGVHQTTVSRQVAALRTARLVELDDRRRVVLHRAAIEETCHTLLAAIQRPVVAETGGNTQPGSRRTDHGRG